MSITFMCCVWTKNLKRNSLIPDVLSNGFQGCQEDSGLPKTKIVRNPKSEEGRIRVGYKKRGEGKGNLA